MREAVRLELLAKRVVRPRHGKAGALDAVHVGHVVEPSSARRAASAEVGRPCHLRRCLWRCRAAEPRTPARGGATSSCLPSLSAFVPSVASAACQTGERGLAASRVFVRYVVGAVKIDGNHEGLATCLLEARSGHDELWRASFASGRLVDRDHVDVAVRGAGGERHRELMLARLAVERGKGQCLRRRHANDGHAQAVGDRLCRGQPDAQAGEAARADADDESADVSCLGRALSRGARRAF